MILNFLSGLPRSGSTLLGAILNQHPDLHVTPTSDLLELIVGIRNTFLTSDSFRAQGIADSRLQVRNGMRGLIEGFYQGHTMVLDKNRAWPAYIELMERVLNREVRILCPIRDLKEVVASFERLRSENPMTAPHGVGADYILQQTMLGRAQCLLRHDGVIGLALRRMVDALQRGYKDRIFLVTYKRLMEEPQMMAQMCFLHLGLKPFQVDLGNLQGPDASKDIEVWGLPLHTIKPQISQNQGTWNDYITQEVADWIDNEFQLVQQLANT